MRVAYETMLAEFERVLKNTASPPTVPTMPPKFSPRIVWPVCSATA